MILEIFGPEAYRQSTLNREFISSAAFSKPELLAQLNSVVHPRVIQDGKDWFQKQKSPYALKEAALIFESGSYSELDYIIGVFSPPEVRIQRIMDREGASYEKVKARMDKQMDEEGKMSRCDTVIYNNELKALIPQVLQVHHMLLEKALQRPM
jgi:dephospho-CoA kinase